MKLAIAILFVISGCAHAQWLQFARTNPAETGPPTKLDPRDAVAVDRDIQAIERIKLVVANLMGPYTKDLAAIAKRGGFTVEDLLATPPRVVVDFDTGEIKRAPSPPKSPLSVSPDS